MDARSQIRVLSDAVINKIAAGEVVERPASVAKELIENALDAGASQVDVDIAAGGRKLVAVADDGVGMRRDDALLCVERHATSKIRSAEDIEHIRTLGFRGEALAAIAAVSRFRLLTCARGESAGTELEVTGGQVRDARDAGVPAGTRIEVRDLFFNIPARRKFLRSYQTELAHLRSVFILLALSHPEVGMSLTVDGRETTRVAAGAGLEDRLRDLFGPEFTRHLRPAASRLCGVAVHGFVGGPSFNRGDRTDQYVFVNGRATSAPVINFAIREGYHTLLPRDRHPVVFLFLDLDPDLVDVNVHPAKREVRFRRPNEVRDAAIRAIRDALAADGARPPAAVPEAGEAAQALRPAADVQLTIEDLPPTRTFRYPRMPVEGPAPATPDRPAGSPAPPSPAGAEAAPARDAPAAAAAGPSPWAWCRVVGQVGGLYVVLETEDGFVIMDPHAAHERVLFERYMSQVLAGAVQTQSLLIPQTVELPPQDALRVRKHLDLLRSMGFGAAEFGGDTFVVDACPVEFAGLSAGTLLIEISRTLEQSGARGGKGRWREESIAEAACKAAVKARDHLSLGEIEQLVVDLARTQMPYTCPHGRPTLIFNSYRDLNKRFGRG